MGRANLQIKFGGQSHQVDANTLINSLIHYNKILTEINNEFGSGSRNVTINVNALKQGSFIIELEVAENIRTVFSNDNVQYAAALITIFGGVVGLYKKRKGKPVVEKSITYNIGDVKIETCVTKIYNQPMIREAISKSIENIDQDSTVESVEFESDAFGVVEMPKTEFKELIYNDFDKEEVRLKEIDEYVDTLLVITGLKFEKGGRWEFFYNGFKIGMIVKDDALMEAINNGARFGKGDTIRVKMKIVKRYNAEYNTYENKSYRIEEFYEHIEYNKPTQSELF